MQDYLVEVFAPHYFKLKVSCQLESVVNAFSPNDKERKTGGSATGVGVGWQRMKRHLKNSKSTEVSMIRAADDGEIWNESANVRKETQKLRVPENKLAIDNFK
jgi:hypothetical protein